MGNGWLQSSYRFRPQGQISDSEQQRKAAEPNARAGDIPPARDAAEPNPAASEASR